MNEEFGQDFLDENKNMIEKMQNSIKYMLFDIMYYIIGTDTFNIFVYIALVII
jgi:hypothetical protein